jgi:integrase
MAEHPYAANRALAVWAKAYTWGAARGLVAEGMNPAKGVGKYREKSRERYLTRAELAALGDALRLAETDGLPYQVNEDGPKAKHAPKPENRKRKLDLYATAAIRLLILTGARLREILDLKWKEVDFERGIAFLPDSKTGAKPLYLSAASLAVISSLPRIEGNPHVIAGARDGAARSDLKKPWAAVAGHAGLEGVRLHGLRHSFASFGAGASLGLPIIGKLLGHTQASTTQRYAHLDADPVKRAAESIGATIQAAMNGDKASPVIPLPKRKK